MATAALSADHILASSNGSSDNNVLHIPVCLVDPATHVALTSQTLVTGQTAVAAQRAGQVVDLAVDLLRRQRRGGLDQGLDALGELRLAVIIEVADSVRPPRRRARHRPCRQANAVTELSASTCMLTGAPPPPLASASRLGFAAPPPSEHRRPHASLRTVGRVNRAARVPRSRASIESRLHAHRYRHRLLTTASSSRRHPAPGVPRILGSLRFVRAKSLAPDTGRRRDHRRCCHCGRDHGTPDRTARIPGPS